MRIRRAPSVLLPLLLYCAVWSLKRKVKNKTMRKNSNLPWLECPLVDWVECICVTEVAAHSLCSLGEPVLWIRKYQNIYIFTGALVPFRLLVLSCCYLRTSTYSSSVPLTLNTCGPILRTGKTRITRYVSWCLLSSSTSTRTEVPPPWLWSGYRNVCVCASACECVFVSNVCMWMFIRAKKCVDHFPLV